MLQTIIWINLVTNPFKFSIPQIIHRVGQCIFENLLVSLREALWIQVRLKPYFDVLKSYFIWQCNYISYSWDESAYVLKQMGFPRLCFNRFQTKVSSRQYHMKIFLMNISCQVLPWIKKWAIDTYNNFKLNQICRKVLKSTKALPWLKKDLLESNCTEISARTTVLSLTLLHPKTKNDEVVLTVMLWSVLHIFAQRSAPALYGSNLRCKSRPLFCSRMFFKAWPQHRYSKGWLIGRFPR